MKYVIKTPVKGFTGVCASLPFFDGKYEGEINNPNVIKYFKKKGYFVEEINEKPKATTTKSRTTKGGTKK